MGMLVVAYVENRLPSGTTVNTSPEKDIPVTAVTLVPYHIDAATKRCHLWSRSGIRADYPVRGYVDFGSPCHTIVCTSPEKDIRLG
jgi:hypothetical protein